MKIEESIINKNINEGVMAICANCERFYNDDGTTGCGDIGCGDEDNGFVKYIGEWGEHIAEWCCLCGRKAVNSININGMSAGICDDEVCLSEIG